MVDQEDHGNEPHELFAEKTPMVSQDGEEGLNQSRVTQGADHCSSETGRDCSPSSIQEPLQCVISAKPYDETVKPSEFASQMEESEGDSEQESSQENLVAASWDELSILERLGLDSAEMTEEEAEGAFSLLALAVRCDQFTLKKRLQAEEKARNLAEKNIHLELDRGREILQSLKTLCLDSKRSKMLQRLELCLSVLRGSVERIATSAELLGAVHQEARLSRAVEVMVAHVENLKRRHIRDRAELEETRRQLQRSSRSRQLSDPRDEGEMRQKRSKTSQQQTTRRRISIAVISKQHKTLRTEFGLPDESTLNIAALSQPLERRLLDGRQLLCKKEDLSGNGNLEAPDELSSTCQAIPPTASTEETENLYLHSPQNLLRHRTGQNIGAQESNSEEKNELEPPSDHMINNCDGRTDDLRTLTSIDRPLQQWMSQCNLILCWLYMMTISFIILLGFLFWCVQGFVF
ncbi:hypothetical protein GJAV_G00190140 [Gymnothorax javanicus]|nr:hypothetical protein GJAV_G00190140 [Gymnothorax javanicus]